MGYLDIVSYAVYEPITDPAWSEPSAFWQIAVEFAAMADPLGYGSGFGRPPQPGYFINMDGAESGSTEGVDPVGEKLRRRKQHPWDIAVTFDGAHAEARLRSADGSIDRSIPMIPVPSGEKYTYGYPSTILSSPASSTGERHGITRWRAPIRPTRRERSLP